MNIDENPAPIDFENNPGPIEHIYLDVENNSNQHEVVRRS